MKEIRKKPKHRDQIKEQSQGIVNPSHKPLQGNDKNQGGNYNKPTGGCGCS